MSTAVLDDVELPDLDDRDAAPGAVNPTPASDPRSPNGADSDPGAGLDGCIGCGAPVPYAGKGRRPKRCPECKAAPKTSPGGANTSRAPGDSAPRRAPGGTDKPAAVAKIATGMLRTLVDVGARLADPALAEIWAPHWPAITEAVAGDFRAHRKDMARVEKLCSVSARGALILALSTPVAASATIVAGRIAEWRAARAAARSAHSPQEAPRRPASAAPPSERRPADPPPVPGGGVTARPDLRSAFGGI